MWDLTYYLIQSRNDRSNIVPTLKFKPKTSYTLGGCLTYCAIRHNIGKIWERNTHFYDSVKLKYIKGGSRHRDCCMARALSFLIRYFSNYYTLHRSDLAARAAPLYQSKFLSIQNSEGIRKLIRHKLSEINFLEGRCREKN